ARDARAHKLDAECKILAMRKVQVESWFSDGRKPKNATVQVFRAADGQLLAEGATDGDGAFVFFADVEPLRVVVDAGEGHHKEMAIEGPTQSATDITTPISASERSAELPIKEALLGIALLLASAAFVLSLRNAWRLRLLDKGRSLPVR